MRPTRAARRSRGKQAWRREAQRVADRAAELARRGSSTEAIAKTLRLSPGLVSLMLEASGEAPGGATAGEEGGGDDSYGLV